MKRPLAWVKKLVGFPPFFIDLSEDREQRAVFLLRLSLVFKNCDHCCQNTQKMTRRSTRQKAGASGSGGSGEKSKVPAEELIEKIDEEMTDSESNKKEDQDAKTTEEVEEMSEPVDEFVVEVTDNLKQEEARVEEVAATEDAAVAAVAQPDEEIVIQIMTPDGQIVTTTTKQTELIQTLQIEGAEGTEGQTFVVQTDEFQEAAVPVEETVTSDVIYQCPACPRTFYRHNAFYGHLRSHRGVIFRCDRDPISCHQEFTALAALRKHQRDVHDTVKEHKCEKCTKSFDKESELRQHVERIHDASRPFACKLCPKSFHKRSDLKQHLRLHLGIKRNACKICGRAFAHLSNLYRHMKVHGQGGHFACGECGQQFLKLAGLNQHMRTHENSAMASLDENLEEVERELLEEEEEEESATLSTDIVEKEVEEQDMIEEKEVKDDGSRRKSSRTAGKSFMCKMCKESFKSEGVAKAHLRSAHTLSDEKQFLCKKCGALFKTEKDCRQHLQKSHLNAMKVIPQDRDEDGFDTPATRKRQRLIKKKKVESDPKTTCKVCAKHCRTPAMLVVHLKEHEKRDLMVCRFCRRDCKTTDILGKHTCHPKSAKNVLNLVDPAALKDHVETIAKTPIANIPAEIVINLPEDQLAEFTKPGMQGLTEKLRGFTTVSLQVKTREEMTRLSMKEEEESHEDSESDEDEADEPTLEEMEEYAERKLGNRVTVLPDPAASFISREGGGDDDTDLDQYMDYIPEKEDQEARLKELQDRTALNSGYASVRKRNDETVVIQTVPVDKPESIIQVQPVLEVLPDKSPDDEAIDDLGQEQFFKVMNMPEITDHEAMITISTDDGNNWVVTSKDASKSDAGPPPPPVLPSRHQPKYSGAVKRSSAIPSAPIIINEPIRYPMSRKFEDEDEEDDDEEEAAEAAVAARCRRSEEAEEETAPKEEAETTAGGEVSEETMEKLSIEAIKSLKKGPNGKYACTVCNNDFTRPESLYQHMAMHDDSLAIKCDQCDMKFAWKSTLRKHRLSVHEGKVLSIPCNLCDRTFKSFGHRKVRKMGVSKPFLSKLCCNFPQNCYGLFNLVSFHFCPFF